MDITEDAQGGIPNSRKQRLRDACQAAQEFFHMRLMRDPSDGESKARSYLSRRGLGGEVPKEWMLGYAPGRGLMVNHLLAAGFKPDEIVEANLAVNRNGRLNDRFYERVMFPIHDVSGECIAFGGRIIGDGEPKYLNSQETPIFHKSNVLFGLDKAKAKMASTGCAVVAEGYTDVIAMHEAGITNSVATLGTALTKSHIRMLSRHAGKRIVYLFDGDAAGQRATERALQFIDHDSTPEAGRTQVEICALCLPDGMDPAEYLDIHSADDLQKLIDGALPLLQFGIQKKLERHDIGTAEGRARAFADAISVLAPIKDSILAKEYAISLAQELQFREDDALAQLAKLKPPRMYGDEAEQESASGNASQMSEMHLTEEASNRAAIERELLGLLVNSPLEALPFMDGIMKVRWRFGAHERIANAVCGELASNLNASPADLVRHAATADANAASLLTSIQRNPDIPLEKVFAYLLQEMRIGDMEADAARLKSQMHEAESGSPDESDLFQQLVVVQEKLVRAQKERVPLV